MADGQLFEPLDVAKVSPFIVENHGLAGALLIPWLLSNSAVFEDLSHKSRTAKWGEPLGRDSLE